MLRLINNVLRIKKIFVHRTKMKAEKNIQFIQMICSCICRVFYIWDNLSYYSIIPTSAFCCFSYAAPQHTVTITLFSSGEERKKLYVMCYFHNEIYILMFSFYASSSSLLLLILFIFFLLKKILLFSLS